jgi:nucleotide-binding universal stress UspA family protein
MDPRTVKRILVPTDFADPSTDALATAIAFALGSGATLDLVHVSVERAFVLPPPVDLAILPMNQAMTQAAEGLAEECARVRAAGVSCESATLVGLPDAEIVTRARETGADLIVMGTHGRSGIVHAVFGSVAEKVVQHGPCPVLIVPRHANV